MVEKAPKDKDSIETEIEEIKSSIREVKVELRRIASCLQKFEEEYIPMLRSMKESDEQWLALKKDIISHAAKGVVWAVIAGSFIFLATSLKTWLKDMLS